ncbi:MAG: ribonuclease III [Alphaproteobacteria bacterium]|jgi:ribonuclease-3|nr:ribonuclease III [Alphaproteobacteria bacterium]
MQDLEQKIGYVFKNKAILRQALTHSSITQDIHSNYERLEFLGDRILGLTIAEMLYNMFPNEPEGGIARRLALLVSKETVSSVVINLGIPPLIRVQMEEIRESLNVLCDIGEALIAAIYLDSKDLNTARAFIKNNFCQYIDLKSRPHKDYKTHLQEEAHLQGCTTPIYNLIQKTGSEHEPHFLVEVEIGLKKASGEGKSKKQAEQNAAQKMLEMLGIKDV